MHVRIAGIGSYLPERRVLNPELEARLALPPGWIERLTGVRERRRVSGETSAGMAALAARAALSHAALPLDALDLIVGASAAPQQAIPCTAAFVQEALGLAESGCPCFDVNATCLSFYVALETAARLIEAGSCRCALVFSSEITSWSLNDREPESAVLFGDAAGAVVLTRTPAGEGSRIWHARLRTDSRGAALTQLRGGGALHHANDPATTPEMNTFAMDGPAVFRMATQWFGPFLNEFFQQVPWERSQTDAVVPHQSSFRGVSQLWKRFGFQPEQVVVNLPERGNCLAASTPLAFAEAVHSGRVRRGDRVLLAGVGAGLSVGAVALTF
ncbi:MAG: beta-ketoacyl-ACP synthase 3 [Actinomycetota bacterium]